MKPDPAHVAWCLNMWNMMAEGGTWGIPRSGLIFNRVKGVLRLTARMPHMPGMPVTPEELATQQDNDFEGTRAHFAEFGVDVVDDTKFDVIITDLTGGKH